MTMIQDYELTKNITTRNGKADLHFAVEAKGIPIEDAKAAGESFDLFLKDLQSELPDGARTRRRVFTMYNDDETKIIEDAPDFHTAWEAYHIAFPKSPRTYDAIRKQWNKQHATDENPSPGSISETRHKPATNDASIPPVQKCTDVRKVAKKKTEVLPAEGKRKGTRSLPSQGSRFKIPAWSDKEKVCIKDCKTKEEAWEKYQAEFPGQRNRNAVFQRFNKLKKTSKAVKKTVPAQKDQKPAPGGGARPKEVKVKDLKITEEPIEPKGSTVPVDTSSGQSSDNVITRNEGDGKDPDPKSVKLVRGMQVRYIGTRPNVAFSGLKEIKKVNELSGEALIDIGKGIEWIPTRDLAVAS